MGIVETNIIQGDKMTRREELHKIIDDARDELRIEIAKEQREESQKFIGKYFKTKNCYSCPESEEDYWCLFQKVIGMDEEGRMQAVFFEITKDKEIKMYYEFGHTDGWIEIEESECVKEWAGMVYEIMVFADKFFK
jgi:hypothetical protein